MSVEALRKTVARLQAGGAKVLISTAGGVIPGCSGDWKALLAPERRAATVAALVELADTLGLDGVDIDIEGQLLTEIDHAGDYTPSIQALSAAMTERGKLLTCATASYEGGMIPVSSIPYFDLVNVMSYDAIGPSWGQPGAEHSTLAMAERDLDLWLARGVAPDRLVLGVPFYGYGFGGEKGELVLSRSRRRTWQRCDQYRCRRRPVRRVPLHHAQQPRDDREKIAPFRRKRRAA